MWERISFWLKLLWDAGKETQENRADIERLDAGHRETQQFIQALAVENEILRKDNEMLRQQLQHERELRERDHHDLQREIRLQIAEALHRLPPAKDDE